MLQPPLGERLTRRAQAYLAIIAFVHGTCGISLLFFPTLFGAQSFAGLKTGLPGSAGPTFQLAIWGGIFTMVATTAAYGAITAREIPARIALFGSVISGFVWMGAFAAAAYDGAKLSPVGVVFAAGLALKDLTMIRDPLRNPFEPIVRKVLSTKER